MIRPGVAASLAGTAALVVLVAAPAPAALGPGVEPVLQGTHGNGDWWRSNVRLSWAIAPSPDSTDGCDTRMVTTETAGATFTCNATLGGITTSVPVVIRIDRTPPSGVTASPTRPPDASSWYTSALGVVWSGGDALSGIASCTSLTYSGPDNGGASLLGTCSDRAGNVSSPTPFSLAFDATPPALAGVTADAKLGAVTLRWAAPADAAQVTVARTTTARSAASQALPASAIHSGRAVDAGLAPGVRYSWVVTVRDAAGNASAATASALWMPPVLRWHRRKGASYYNVQLFRGQRKVLSSWPRRARHPLKGRWSYSGRTQTLDPGVYTWLAWPGYGPRDARRYGRLAARGRFTIG